MKPHMYPLACAAIFLALSFPAAPRAQAPLQLSIVNPYQLVSEYDSVRGLGLGLCYTVNYNLTGVMLAPGVNKLFGDMRGIQLGLINLDEGDMVGYQGGVFNRIGGNVRGWQNGLVNINANLTRGLQTGIFNLTDDMRGVQLGLYNSAISLTGFQVGLINLNASGMPFGFLPIINFSF